MFLRTISRPSSDVYKSQVLSHRAKKGDVIATARIAGIMAAKKTSELIPLCHPVMLTNVTLSLIHI